ncbi:MAG: hypothetical protein AVDCRST_MAG27-4260 [uncultured Craurococcus sp.]|uniref:Uncharacterized protein n=1 Tax=uncultured Craurococcus sp. TaxID=1135998 RepID=A0A6J4JSE4_9PROT|nr:MAG: hypothetical protein AVDCRST_MAG27-4260 [uncultured Craurococcus sp.]
MTIRRMPLVSPRLWRCRLVAGAGRCRRPLHGALARRFLLVQEHGCGRMRGEDQP